MLLRFRQVSHRSLDAQGHPEGRDDTLCRGGASAVPSETPVPTLGEEPCPGLLPAVPGGQEALDFQNPGSPTPTGRPVTHAPAW